MLPFSCWLLIYSIYESLLLFYFSLSVLNIANISGFLSIPQTCQAHQPSGFLSLQSILPVMLFSQTLAGRSLWVSYSQMSPPPPPRHCPLHHPCLLALGPYHSCPVHSLFTCVLFVSILAVYKFQGLLVTLAQCLAHSSSSSVKWMNKYTPVTPHGVRRGLRARLRGVYFEWYLKW